MRRVEGNLIEFFELLRKKRISFSNVLESTAALSSVELLDFAREAYDLVRPYTQGTRSVFNFAASSSLGGGPFPCFAVWCRLENLDSLARFTALYADTVFIANPFEKYLFREKLSSYDRHEIAGSLAGILYLQPLFEAGLLAIRNNLMALCAEHVMEIQSVEEEVRKRLVRAERQLHRRLLKQTNAYIDDREGEVFVDITSPEYFFEHSGMVLTGELPQSLVQVHTKGRKHKLTTQELGRSGLLRVMTNPVLDDIFSQNIHAYLYGSQYLTNREIDLKVAASVGNPELIATSKALLAGLAHSVPTVEAVGIDRLVHLRLDEGEAFKVYRDRLQKALKSAQKLGVKEMRQLVDDEIRPEINRIEYTIKHARRSLVGSLKTDLLVGAGYIAVGLFSGFLPPDAGNLLAALGGYKFTSSLVQKAVQLRDSSAYARDNPYYFLWKIKSTHHRM